MGRGRLLVVVLLIYVGLDLGSPLVPGAFAFDPDESVEGFRADRHRLPGADAGLLAVAVPRAREAARVALRPSSAPRPVVARARPIAPLPRADLAGSPLPAPPDDH